MMPAMAAHKECDVGDGHVFAKAVHGGVIVGTDGVDDSTGAKEEEPLEHCMSEEVEHRGHVAESVMSDFIDLCDTQRHHHECDLRYGGKCQHSLDVDLRACHNCGI